MASAASTKKMVSSVFITLSTPDPVSRQRLSSASSHAHARDAADDFPPPPPPAVPFSPLDDSPLPPRDAAPPAHQDQQVRTGASQQPNGIQANDKSEARGMCAFCRKSIASSERMVEALNKSYHGDCFQCRSCHAPLAGQQFYNHAGIPFCEECHEATMELCWACGEAIKDRLVRALERAYHVSCFTCATCKQPIERFAQGEVGEVYCLQDYYRKYAPTCGACILPIIPQDDGTDSFHVECLGRSFHVSCYRCEVCRIWLSQEPDEHGCYPLDGRLLCKPCHQKLASGRH